MASTLPTNPSLDKLRVEARKLQRANGIALHAAQLTVARRYGFTGWPALVHYLRLAADLSVDPGAVDDDTLRLRSLHTTPLVRPDDVVTGLRRLDERVSSEPALLTRLRQGPLVDGEIADPLR